MQVRRRILWIALAFVGAACAGEGPSGLGPDVRRDLAHGREAATSWIVEGREAEDIDGSTAIALGYLERLRLGLGEPFRLADHALHDPRLGDETRRNLAWAILARTIDRASYQIEDAALDRVNRDGLRGGTPMGREHLRLIDGAIRESRDPRAGELAVRIAYALVAAEGVSSGRGLELAARAAALIRDREVARADALRLLRAAEQADVDALQLLVQWRADRRFEVEAPLLGPLPQATELEALVLAPRLAGAVRELPFRADIARPRYPVQATLLGDAAAVRLTAIADSFDAPPQTPIVVALQAYSIELAAGGASVEDQRLRDDFARRATSEERFVAAYARLPRRGPAEATPPLIALNAAVAMRAYAQEPVWFPGAGGPTNRELEERFGLASIEFGPSVKPAWRPYYRRMLAVALSDLYRVLPSLELRGLTVVFGGDPAMRETTLALHDPRRRRLILPPATAAGTIAHEVAHDLDWQVALERYRVRGDYASDRAVRRRDRHAVPMTDLAGAYFDSYKTADRLATHGNRPAEIFARNVDWFVAVSLAAQGRTNGYLSSVQDDLLTGYGTVQPPDVSGAAGNALVTILDEVAPMYPGTREWFLRSYGLNRALTPYDLVRRIVEEPPPDTMEFGPVAAVTRVAFDLAPLLDARAAGLAAIDTWVCRAPGAAYHRGLEDARRRLVIEAVGARARGVALSHAAAIAGSAGRRWVARRLFGAPWPTVDVDSATTDALQPLAAMAEAVATVDLAVTRDRLELLTGPRHCAGAPLR